MDLGHDQQQHLTMYGGEYAGERSVAVAVGDSFMLQVTGDRQTCKKTIILHKRVLSQKIFYQKKCVNIDKSNLRQNSVNGQKDPNSVEKLKKST